MDIINFEDFQKIEIRVGKIIAAQIVEDSSKLVKLQVDFGNEQRQILSGIARFYQPDFLIGKLCPFVVNLAPKTMGDLESQGMMLCADDHRPVLLHPDQQITPGSVIK